MAISHRVRRVLMIVGAIAIGGYLAILLLLFFAQRSLLFPAQPTRQPLAKFAQLRRVGSTFVLYRKAEPGQRTVVHFHGNGEQLADEEWLTAELAAFGAGHLVVEYPGYGLVRDQQPSEAAIVSAAKEAVAFLQSEEKVAVEDTVLLGQSLGSGVAVQLAAQGLAGRVVLLTPYLSIRQVAGELFPFVPTALIRDPFDSVKHCPRVKVPTLIVHGTRDEVVPYAHGKSLSGHIEGSRLLTIEGGTHNDLWDKREVRDAVYAFVRER